MFDIELSNIARITERVLGHPKKTVDIDGWNEFNCPYCCEEGNEFTKIDYVVDFCGERNAKTMVFLNE